MLGWTNAEIYAIQLEKGGEMGFLIRWLAAFVMIAATYNPTDMNYTKWAARSFSDQLPLIVLAGLVLFICYVIFFRATLRSIGGFGMTLVMAVFAALIWVLYDFGLLALNNGSVNVWMGILALSLVLGIGLSWSFVRRAMSGQFDVDETDE